MGEKVALIDVCDTVCDLHRVTLEMANLRLRPEQITSWDIFEMITPEESERVMALYGDLDFWRSLPPISGSHEGIDALRRQGYSIQWVTSPWWTCEGWESARRAWLAQHFDVEPKNVTFTSEKYMIDGDIFIDDRPKHVQLWKARRPKKRAWLFDTMFNTHFKWEDRCTWSPTGIRSLP